MRIKALSPLGTADGTRVEPGETVDLPDAEAAFFVGSGDAEAAPEPRAAGGGDGR